MWNKNKRICSINLIPDGAFVDDKFAFEHFKTNVADDVFDSVSRLIFPFLHGTNIYNFTYVYKCTWTNSSIGVVSS